MVEGIDEVILTLQLDDFTVDRWSKNLSEVAVRPF